MKTGTNFNSKYGKKLIDTAIKTGKDFATIAGKKIVHKSAEATGDLVGNKIADKITSMVRSKELGPAVKPRSKKEKDEINIMKETQEIYIPSEKGKQIIKDLKLFYTYFFFFNLNFFLLFHYPLNYKNIGKFTI